MLPNKILISFLVEVFTTSPDLQMSHGCKKYILLAIDVASRLSLCWAEGPWAPPPFPKVTPLNLLTCPIAQVVQNVIRMSVSQYVNMSVCQNATFQLIGIKMEVVQNIVMMSYSQKTAILLYGLDS